MNKWPLILKATLTGGLFAASASCFAAYNSGSTGADGVFNPTTSQSIQLPPDGVFNYASVNIPTGVVITYIKNAANTPVTILSQGDVTVDGTIDVSATAPLNSADMSGAGLGGPGGYNGGRGGQPGGGLANWINGYVGSNVGRAGIGPGGGAPGAVSLSTPGYLWWVGTNTKAIMAGGGGAFGSAPPSPIAFNYTQGSVCQTTPGVTYGNLTMIPLVGGSGGGGGVGGTVLPGTGGGGGGGAILIASSTTITVNGAILANGGIPVSSGTLDGRGSRGGGGSGGAIRLIATTVSGNGTISAVGGSYTGEVVNLPSGYGVCANAAYFAGGSNFGGNGRIRIEAENLARTTASTPPWVGGAPNLAFVPGLPTLKIESVGGVAVPTEPSGVGDVALPPNFTNPVTVTFVTSGVTVGSTIKLTVIPAVGLTTSATSAPTTGTANSATASVTTTLSPGPNTLQASVTYTVVAAIGDAMSVYAQGERVEKVTLASTLGSKESQVTLTTVSGKQYVVPASVLALAKA